MALVRQIPIRGPLPGETWLVRPVEAAVGWYPMHRIRGRYVPCAAGRCLDCGQSDRPPRVYWCGYLMVADVLRQSRPAVAIITAGAYRTCTLLRTVPLPLPCYALCLYRGGAGVRGAVTCEVRYSGLSPHQIEPAPYLSYNVLMARWCDERWATAERMASYVDLWPVSGPDGASAPLEPSVVMGQVAR